MFKAQLDSVLDKSGQDLYVIEQSKCGSNSIIH